jgi:nitric oxide reductase large subunit
VGFVAYELFKIIPEAQLAGNIAGQLFKIMAYVGMASSIFLLIQRVYQYGTNALKQGFFWLVLLMLILILVSHLGINPLVEKFKLEAMPKDVMESVFADRFSTWHGISNIAYLLECFLGIFAILKIR